jgi:hypothetical protein
MLTQDMFFHKSNTMFLGVKSHTFLPFDGITSTITLANIIANHTMHSLKQNKIWLIAIIHHQKKSRERQSIVKDPCFKIKDELNL